MSIDPEDAAPVIAAHKRSADNRMREILFESISEVEKLSSVQIAGTVPLEAALKVMTRVANGASETGCEIGRLEGADEVTASDERLRKVVGLLRKASKYLEEMSVREVGNALESMTVCDACRASQYSGMGVLRHDADCLVTRLRSTADEIERGVG
jgi:hypothetical protein